MVPVVVRALAVLLIAGLFLLTGTGPVRAMQVRAMQVRAMPAGGSAMMTAGCHGAPCRDHGGSHTRPMMSACVAAACVDAVGFPASPPIARSVAVAVARYHPLPMGHRAGELPAPTAPPPRLD